MFNYRRIQVLGLLICIGLLGFSYFLEFYRHFAPCSLCLLQRWNFMLLSVFFLLGACFTQNRVWRRLQSCYILIFATLGTALAGRQLWLEYFPSQHIVSCSADVSYLVNHLPFHKAIMTMLQGSPECTQNVWSFLGLGIAGWSLIFFMSFTLLGLYQIRRS